MEYANHKHQSLHLGFRDPTQSFWGIGNGSVLVNRLVHVRYVGSVWILVIPADRLCSLKELIDDLTTVFFSCAFAVYGVAEIGLAWIPHAGTV